jgi:hypothetical protein
LRRELRASLIERSQLSQPVMPAVPSSESEADETGNVPVEARSNGVLKIEISVPAEQWKLYGSMARAAGLSLESWAVLVVSQAARKA